ncbi:unnamed protein product [Larinioides sclopetarius]|uniref:Uncharacterized protein n=1 Tax=Larinioides sclopetarius TaxID=280406 RepID=A0AAV1ZUT2_9ARAC
MPWRRRLAIFHQTRFAEVETSEGTSVQELVYATHIPTSHNGTYWPNRWALNARTVLTHFTKCMHRTRVHSSKPNSSPSLPVTPNCKQWCIGSSDSEVLQSWIIFLFYGMGPG